MPALLLISSQPPVGHLTGKTCCWGWTDEGGGTDGIGGEEGGGKSPGGKSDQAPPATDHIKSPPPTSTALDLQNSFGLLISPIHFIHSFSQKNARSSFLPKANMIRISGKCRCSVHFHAKISSPFSVLLFFVLFYPITSQQNFLALIQPFLGTNGQQQSSSTQQQSAPGPQQPQAQQPPAEPPMGDSNSFGGIGQFVELFKNVQQQGTNGEGVDRGERVQQAANMAQKVLATFSNSQGSVGPSASRSSAGGLNEYLSFGRNFGLGSALQEKRRKRQAPSGDLFKLLQDVGRKASERRRQHSPAPSRQARPFQSNSPFIRLTDNFGRNFFQVDSLMSHLI